MAAQGTAVVNFGAYGSSTSDASVVITGQTGIVSGSLVEAWLSLTASADHSADEHMLERIKVFAGNIVAGTGFTIYALDDNQQMEPATAQGKGVTPKGASPTVYGQWNINWVWN